MCPDDRAKEHRAIEQQVHLTIVRCSFPSNDHFYDGIVPDKARFHGIIGRRLPTMTALKLRPVYVSRNDGHETMISLSRSGISYHQHS